MPWNFPGCLGFENTRKKNVVKLTNLVFVVVVVLERKFSHYDNVFFPRTCLIFFFTQMGFSYEAENL